MAPPAPFPHGRAPAGARRSVHEPAGVGHSTSASRIASASRSRSRSSSAASSSRHTGSCSASIASWTHPSRTCARASRCRSVELRSVDEPHRPVMTRPRSSASLMGCRVDRVPPPEDPVDALRVVDGKSHGSTWTRQTSLSSIAWNYDSAFVVAACPRRARRPESRSARQPYEKLQRRCDTPYSAQAESEGFWQARSLVPAQMWCCCSDRRHSRGIRVGSRSRALSWGTSRSRWRVCLCSIGPSRSSG